MRSWKRLAKGRTRTTASLTPAVAERAVAREEIELHASTKRPHIQRSHGAWVVYSASKPIARYAHFRSACAYARARTDLYLSA